MDDKKSTQKSLNLKINLETTPIIYTDNIHMSTNEEGVVISVGQKVFNTNQVQIVTRIGMSRDHAKKFVTKLGNLLALTEGQSQTSGKVKH